MATQRYVLKVLNGIYSGSELPLESGEYVFGNAADNDINIEDPALQAKEGQLIVSDDSVVLQLEQQERAVHFGGRPYSDQSVQLQPFVPVYLGEFCFALGLDGQPWPELDLGRYEPEPEPAEDVLGEDDAADADNSGNSQGDAGVAVEGELPQKGHSALSEGDAAGTAEPPSAESDALVLDEANDEKDEQSTEQVQSRSGWRAKAVVVALLMVVVCVGGFVSFSMWQSSLEDQARRERQRISNEQLLQDVIDQSGLKIEIREPEIPAGKPRLVGYIATEKERAAFIAELDRVEARYQSDVYVVEQMLQAGYSLLNAFSFRGVDLSAGRRPGTVVAKGYIENLERWLKIKVVIERDIEGLLALVDEVDTPAIRLGKLEESILRAGLDNEVKLYLSPDGLILARTSLSFENEPKWKILEDAFKKSFGNEPRLVTLIDDNNWIRIVAINFSGPVPYIVLEDGRKYIEGSSLDNGYKLKEISPNGVILRGQFGERVMPLKLTN